MIYVVPRVSTNPFCDIINFALALRRKSRKWGQLHVFLSIHHSITISTLLTLILLSLTYLYSPLIFPVSFLTHLFSTFYKKNCSFLIASEEDATFSGVKSSSSILSKLLKMRLFCKNSILVGGRKVILRITY